MYRRAILGLGYLPQETSIFRGLTVSQNIMAVLEVAEPDRRVREQRLEQLMGEFHIEHLRDAPAMAVSGRERLRCELSRARAAAPSIMLLDAPCAGIGAPPYTRICGREPDCKHRDYDGRHQTHTAEKNEWG